MQNPAVIPGRQAQARQAGDGGLSDDMAQKGINREDEPGCGPIVVKTFFLAKEIHRIGTQSIRGKKFPRKPGRQAALAATHNLSTPYRAFPAVDGIQRLAHQPAARKAPRGG
jgi:homoaconitase/3-isopropylmalate dehydratase large subunit